jgi:peptidoglycan/LPS O-acetylase OafA/YrhL
MPDAVHRTASERLVGSVLAKNRNLDVLRMIAVLCVLVDHTLKRALQPQTGELSSAIVDGLNNLGFVGVLIFFVHTCRVLMASIARSRRAAESRWVTSFYIRRGFRIYPLAWVALALWLVGGFYDGVIHRDVVLSNALLVQNVLGRESMLGVLWSLPVEIQMYLLLPLVYVLAHRGWKYLVLCLIVAVVAGALVEWSPRGTGLWRLDVFAFAPCFMGGVLAYFIGLNYTRSPLPAWTWPAFIIGWAVAANFLFGFGPGTPGRGWVFCLALGVALPAFKEMEANRFTTIAAIIAEYSYGIYLLHSAALAVAFDWIHVPEVLQWLIYLPLLAGSVWAGYHFVESPGIRLGKSAVAMLTGRAVPRQSPAATAPAP